MSVEERGHGGVSCTDEPVFLVVVLDLFFPVVRAPASAKGLCRCSHSYRCRPDLDTGMCAVAPCPGAQQSFLGVSSRSRQNGGLRDRQGVRNPMIQKRVEENCCYSDFSSTILC